ncbi:MAG: glycoside hydrolase family 43 protein [Saprospiraceae bacterium]|nr:glycoside hydrolase family 43 protein [Saprospiraceae bacterium]
MLIENHGKIFYGTSLCFALGFTSAQNDYYLFSYFMNNGEDGLHLAYSEDGYTWEALNSNKSLLTPTVGKDKLMRDPCIVAGGDGKYHMVWTVSWTEQGIGYATSQDLIHWSDQRYLPVMEHEQMAKNCWAPELFFDKEFNQYMIFWSTTIPGRFLETDSNGDNGYNHRMYYVTTKDFIDFADTRLLYDQGFNVIDGTLQKINGRYILFLKNEIKYPVAEKNIRIATSEVSTGPYSVASKPITGNWVEGPTALEMGNEWIVYFDRYTEHRMGAVKSSDLQNWVDISDQVSFPEGTRHGSVIRIDSYTLKNLKNFQH